MASLADQNKSQMRDLTSYLKCLERYNEQWRNPEIAKRFIHATNEEVTKDIVQKHRCLKEKMSSCMAGRRESSSQKNSETEKKTNKATAKENIETNSQAEEMLLPPDREPSANHEYPFAMTKNEELGRYLVSTRDITAGEVVLLEAPLVIGPIVRQPFEKSTPTCIHCYRATNDYLCPECGFYLCRGTCKERHPQKKECTFLRKLELVKEQRHIHAMENRNFAEKVATLPEDERAESLEMISKAYLNFVQEERSRLMRYYPAIATLKALCLMSDSKAVSSSISFLHGEVDPTLMRYKINQKIIVNTLRKLDVPYEEAFIHRVADIWDTNGFEMKLTRLPVQALFVAASLLTHSCKPNCEHNFSSSGIMVLRAVEDIPSGTMLTLSYSDKIWPTYIRRDHLRVTKKFICQCDRCLDPTECGTFIGHVKCESCGHLSVCAYHGEELCPSLTCSHCSCDIFAKEFFKREAAACSLFGNCSANTLGEYEGAVGNLEEIFKGRYHDNHHLIQRLRMEFLFENSQTDVSGLCAEDLKKFVTIATAAFQWCSKVLPRLSQQRARVAREWLRLRKELHSRNWIPADQDEEMNAAMQDAKIALHWDQKLPQVV